MNIQRKTYPNIVKGLFAFAFTILLTNGLLAYASQQSEQPKDSSLVQVETKYVCMINNQRFDKEQIPVEVEGQTYYGCCEMCKEKLRNDKASRTATDPVSGKKVDKAKAVIGANSEGKVFYFENAENLKKFKADAASSGDKHNADHKSGHNH